MGVISLSLFTTSSCIISEKIIQPPGRSMWAASVTAIRCRSSPTYTTHPWRRPHRRIRRRPRLAKRISGNISSVLLSLSLSPLFPSNWVYHTVTDIASGRLPHESFLVETARQSTVSVSEINQAKSVFMSVIISIVVLFCFVLFCSGIRRATVCGTDGEYETAPATEPGNSLKLHNIYNSLKSTSKATLA